jgi:hypothetical protein
MLLDILCMAHPNVSTCVYVWGNQGFTVIFFVQHVSIWDLLLELRVYLALVWSTFSCAFVELLYWMSLFSYEGCSLGSMKAALWWTLYSSQFITLSSLECDGGASNGRWGGTLATCHGGRVQLWMDDGVALWSPAMVVEWNCGSATLCSRMPCSAHSKFT